MRSNTSALFRNRFFGDLDQDFLAFVEQVSNCGLLAITITTGKVSIAALTAGRSSLTWLPCLRAFLGALPRCPVAEDPAAVAAFFGSSVAVSA